jgi:hypothetical protein
MGSSVSVSGSVGVGATLGNGSDSVFDVDAGLDDVRVANAAGQAFQVSAGLDNIQVGNLQDKPFQVATGLDNIKVTQLPTIELKVALTEIPRVRAHVPQHYDFCISFFGLEIWRFSLCGESQVITEPYVARHPEVCK